MEGFEKLTNSLLAAKQVMNKVDKGDYQTGNVNPSALSQDIDNFNQNPQTSSRVNQSPVSANINEEKIRNSRLPENIKQLMIENPIPTLDVNNELPSGFIDEVAKKMEEQSKFGSGAQKINKTPKNQSSQPTLNNEDLKSFIKQTIVETLDEIIDTKLNKLMESNKSVDENLKIQVGDSVFIGKISDVRKAK